MQVRLFRLDEVGGEASSIIKLEVSCTLQVRLIPPKVGGKQLSIIKLEDKLKVRLIMTSSRGLRSSSLLH